MLTFGLTMLLHPILNFDDNKPVNFRQNDDGVTKIDVFSST